MILENEGLHIGFHHKKLQNNKKKKKYLHYIFNIGTMKVRPSAKKICQNCKIVVRRFQGKRCVRVICPTDPKHKQRQG